MHMYEMQSKFNHTGFMLMHVIAKGLRNTNDIVDVSVAKIHTVTHQ